MHGQRTPLAIKNVVQRSGSFSIFRDLGCATCINSTAQMPRLITWSHNIQQRRTTAIATVVGCYICFSHDEDAALLILFPCSWRSSLCTLCKTKLGRVNWMVSGHSLPWAEALQMHTAQPSNLGHPLTAFEKVISVQTQSKSKLELLMDLSLSDLRRSKHILSFG